MGGAAIADRIGTSSSGRDRPEAGRPGMAGVSHRRDHTIASVAVLLPVRARRRDSIHSPLGETGVWFPDGSATGGQASGESVAGGYPASTACGNGLRCGGVGSGTRVLGKGDDSSLGVPPRSGDTDAAKLFTALR